MRSQDLEKFFDGMSRYYASECDYKVLIKAIQQEKGLQGVGGIFAADVGIIDKDLCTIDRPYACFVMIHGPGHVFHLRTGDDRALKLAKIKFDTLKQDKPRIRERKLREGYEIELIGMNLGLAAAKDACDKGYLPDITFHDILAHAELYFAYDGEQYSQCLTTGECPLYGLPLRRRASSRRVLTIPCDEGVILPSLSQRSVSGIVLLHAQSCRKRPVIISSKYDASARKAAALRLAELKL